MTIIELFYLNCMNVARIKKGDRDTLYIHVTSASVARLGTYVFERIEDFHVAPFVTGTIGWTAQGEAPHNPPREEKPE